MVKPTVHKNPEDMTVVKRKMFTRLKRAIEGSAGNLTHICENSGASMSTVRKWLELNPRIREYYDAEVEKTIDIAESELLKKIKAGNLNAIMFFLARKGASRGYGDKSKIDALMPMQINNYLDKKDIKELKELENNLKG